MTDTIRRFLDEELPAVAQTLRDDDELLKPGLLDSLAIVRLVAAIEQGEGVLIDEDEISPENFRSLRTIRALVARKKAAVQ